MEEDDFDSIAADPVAAAREIRKDFLELRRGFRNGLYHHLALAYEVADLMLTNKEAWKNFIEDEFWTKHRKKRPGMEARKEPLLHVMVFIFNTGTYDRAWKYAKALKQHFEDRVPPHCIEDIIKQEGGIEKMVRAASGHSQDDGEDVKKPIETVVKDTADQKKAKTPKSKKMKAAQSGGIGNTKPPMGTMKKRGPRKYSFIASKNCGPEIRHLREGQKARITVEMVNRHEKLFPKVIAIKALKPLAR
jgi:hypothetical protein